VSINKDLVRIFETKQPHHSEGMGSIQPFTEQDHAAINRYNETTGVLDDCLDVISFTSDDPDDSPAMIKMHFDWLREWYEALDSLYSDLGTGPDNGLPNAAIRLIEHETNRFFHTLNLVRRQALLHLIGDAGPCPEVDSGTVTFFDCPPKIQLNGTTVAESL
jgi:hypothetical protein